MGTIVKGSLTSQMRGKVTGVGKFAMAGMMPSVQRCLVEVMSRCASANGQVQFGQTALAGRVVGQGHHARTAGAGPANGR